MKAILFLLVISAGAAKAADVNVVCNSVRTNTNLYYHRQRLVIPRDGAGTFTAETYLIGPYAHELEDADRGESTSTMVQPMVTDYHLKGTRLNATLRYNLYIDSGTLTDHTGKVTTFDCRQVSGS